MKGRRTSDRQQISQVDSVGSFSPSSSACLAKYLMGCWTASGVLMMRSGPVGGGWGWPVVDGRESPRPASEKANERTRARSQGLAPVLSRSRLLSMVHVSLRTVQPHQSALQGQSLAKCTCATPPRPWQSQVPGRPGWWAGRQAAALLTSFTQ